MSRRIISKELSFSLSKAIFPFSASTIRLKTASSSTIFLGLGGMGGAQPLAVTMAGGVVICIEIDNHRINRRLDTNYLDKATDSFEKAVKMAAAKLMKSPKFRGKGIGPVLQALLKGKE